MNYLTPDERYYACDLEADNLREEVTKIWCVCVESLSTDERLSFFDKAAFTAWLEESDRVLVGHNFLAYDTPVLNRLWDTRISISKIIDTFVLSQMYSANLVGGHSLSGWGERLGFEKGDHTDFSEFSTEMLEYCKRDVTLTKKLYLALVKRMKSQGISEEACELEHSAWHIIQNKQKQNGFPFNQEKADLLYAELRTREAALKDEIYALWPPRIEHVRTFARAFKANGERTKRYSEHLGQYPRLEVQPDGSYHAYDYVSFDLGSPQQRIQKFLDLGWRPVNFTKKGAPKIDEDEMLAFSETSGIAEAAALAKWCVVNARGNMVRTWMNAVNPKTGHIHGSLFLASTGRYKHSGPNTANIPGVRHDKADNVLFGEEGTWAYECRALWDSGGDDWDMVGMDGKGMQLRCLAHNLARVIGKEAVAEFIADLLEGDIHRKNMERFGIPSKPASKKIIYTALMGGGAAKIAVDQVQFGWNPPKNIKDLVMGAIPGYNDLVSFLTRELEKTGRITLVDGHRLLVPSPHMVIPYLLQGDESRLMKRTMKFIDREVTRHRLQKSILKVGDIHDEFQYRTRPDYSESFIEFSLPCFRAAGDSFEYLIPIEGDAKIGKNWAETH